MIPEKLSAIERAMAVAATMSIHDSRRVIKLICEAGMMMDKPVMQEPSEGAKHYSKREGSIKRMHSSCGRVLDYAKHETLRNIEKHFRETPPITSAEGAPDSEPTGTLAARLTFKRPDFTTELLAALREEALFALTIAGQQLFDEVGWDDPWKMPGDYSTGFLNYRANLLADVPDEVHKTIMSEIQQGLDAGDSRRELMKRISTKFDETYKGRMETVANTETAAAFNFARDRAMKEAGVTHKKWLLSHSPLIKEHRATHAENDGQIQPIDEPFDIGGVQFMYPGDDTLGAGPEDIINCHCVAIPVEKPVKSGEGEGHPFRGNQYITVYRGSLKPEPGHPRLRDFGVVFSATDQSTAEQYGSFVTKWGIENPKLLDTSSMEAQLLAERFSGQRYNSVADWEDVFFDYYGAPTKQFAKFLASKGYDGFQTGKDIAIFDPSKMVRL